MLVPRFMQFTKDRKAFSNGGPRRFFKYIQEKVCYSTFRVNINSDAQSCDGHLTETEFPTESLAKGLASVTQECSVCVRRRSQTRTELKRFIRQRIKKRVKKQYLDGKFYDLTAKVVALPETLQDAYTCIRLDSNIESTGGHDDICFASMAKQLTSGCFDIQANTYRFTRKRGEEYLVLPNMKLRIVQEAIRMVVEVVYKSQFCKISHGYRSGRGQQSAVRYICKEIGNPDYCFMLFTKKKIDSTLFNTLISTMEEKIKDDLLYSLLSSMLDNEVLNVEFGGFPKGQGLPQEGILSPLLINIYLDIFDQEFIRMCMRHECLDVNADGIQLNQQSKLRKWFRRQVTSTKALAGEDLLPRVRACRYMDEIFVSVSGNKEITLNLKNEVVNYLTNTLHLEVMEGTQIFSSSNAYKLQFLGSTLQNSTSDSHSLRAVHKLKDKLRLFTSQQQEIWDNWTLRIGKKWLGHALQKIKESETDHGKNNSILAPISQHRKPGMKTDHWFKCLIKNWIQDLAPHSETSAGKLLSKHLVEPAIPEELILSFNDFQQKAQRYISSETAFTLSLPLVTNTRNPRLVSLAPIDAIMKSLLHYGIVNGKGFPQCVRALVLQDDHHIVTWFAGLVHRWHKWFGETKNFGDVISIIDEYIRKSCIRTLAAKHRIIESEIENKFALELSGIPSSDDIESGEIVRMKEFNPEDDEVLLYGSVNSGLCLLFLIRVDTGRRPCTCFVMCCSVAGSGVYTLHAKERRKHPGWKTGFATAIHPALHDKRLSLCKQHLKDLYMGHISLQAIDFGASGSWTSSVVLILVAALLQIFIRFSPSTHSRARNGGVPPSQKTNKEE